MDSTLPRRVLILGAAGRDFHNFNVFFRNNPEYQVVGFTAAQIPDIDNRLYPSSLAGPLYPQGIPIWNEDDLETLIFEHKVDEVVFAYSDISYQALMNKSARAMSAGASFRLLGPKDTMLSTQKPVIAVTAVRTGCGKSQTTRRVANILTKLGKKIVVVRHPMPYGDLNRQKVQRFTSLADLTANQCTIEEMEEYEPHLRKGITVYAGVDYQEILNEVEKEAEIILWDGGNNDFPFYRPHLQITVVDPLRPGHEVNYFPGEVNLRRAHIVVINKIDSARPEDVDKVRYNIRKTNPYAIVIEAASPISADNADIITGKRVLIIEDGPTATHGEMSFGAGYILAQKYGAREIIDPRPYLIGSLRETFQNYPQIGPVLPAMGYSPHQIEELSQTIRNAQPELLIIGTPVDLRRIIDIPVPTIRVTYELQEIGRPTLEDVIGSFLEGKGQKF